ncbi:hypothetical protein N1F78_12890 [Seonamhaeicola sp. MEBiC1930]|uniref:tetratricopeptide repeat protein n=1 Tax=Seonamhaeicola sp. MEBiC01930 TaxID=2976768 RepID=UPI00325152F7
MKPVFLFIIVILLSYNSVNGQNLAEADSLINIFNNETNKIEKVKTAQKIFHKLKHTNPEKAFDFANKGLKLSKKNNSTSGEGIAYHHLAYYYRFLPNIDSSRYYFKKAYQTLEEHNHIEALCNAIEDYAALECLQGNYDKAIKIADRGFKHANNIKNSHYVLMSLSRKTTTYMDNGKFEAAAKENIKALKILDTIHPEDKYGKAVTLGLSARIEMLRGNYQLTLEPLEKSLKLFTSLNDLSRLAVTHMEIGNANWYLEDYDAALKNYKESLTYSKKIQRYDFISMNLSNMASIYSDKGDYIEALKITKNSIEVEKKIGSKINLTIGYNSLANIYSSMKDYNQSIKYFTKAIVLADSIKASDVIRDGYFGRFKTYEKMANYKAALNDLTKYVNIQDSLFSLESAKQIEELKTIYETEKKEAEIALQEQEINNLNQEVKVSNLTKTLYGIGMISFIAIASLLYFSFKQRIKKNRIEREKQEAIFKQEIEFKKKELASQTLHLVQKNTFIQELKDNLEKIKKSPELFKIEFRRLVMLLKKESAEDKDWEVFKSYFTEVHNNFDNKLKEIYPDIGEKEIRLASFLRMNLSTKEIASMINVLPESVLKSKYRLKKKLQLDKETDLNSFLKSL